MKSVSLFACVTVFATANHLPSLQEVGPQYNVIPDARPHPTLRKFTSQAVEDKIAEVKAAIKDVNLQQFFANTYPSTLDTTVAWTDLSGEVPRSFVITGDIPAMWLRDSMNQVIHYVPVMDKDPELEKLILGVINLQSEFIDYFPYGNAFKAPAESGIESGSNEWAQNDYVSPRPAGDEFMDKVWESKYELDSLAAFLRLATTWVEKSGKTAELKKGSFISAVQKAVDLMVFLQTGSNEQAWIKDADKQKYVFRRTANAPTETCYVGGEGSRAKRTGMVRSGFRPSDDACMFPFLVPSNMMAYTALENLYCMADSLGIDAAYKAKIGKLANEIEAGIAEYAVVDIAVDKLSTAKKSKVFAFEVSGFPGQYNVMDDANVPSLLSAPDLGYLKSSCKLPQDVVLSLEDRATIYADTRKLILDQDLHAWYFQRYGSDGNKVTGIEGIGGPHTGLDRVWPMAMALRALTLDHASGADEIKAQLTNLMDSQAGSGLMHEGVWPNDPRTYTRQWFAWANTVFGQLVLELHETEAGKKILQEFTWASNYSEQP